MTSTTEWLQTAEEQWDKAWETVQADARRLGLLTAQTAATIALARETARLADAQERTADMAEAQALALCGLINTLHAIVPPTEEARAAALSRYERIYERFETLTYSGEGGAR